MSFRLDAEAEAEAEAAFGTQICCSTSNVFTDVVNAILS